MNGRWTSKNWRTHNGVFQESSRGRVDLPRTLRRIEARTFEGCSKLRSITLPDSLERIETRCFRKSGLTEIQVPNAGVCADKSAFGGCPAKGSLVFQCGRVFRKDTVPQKDYVCDDEIFREEDIRQDGKFRVIVTNIPEKFQANDFRTLLEQACIPYRKDDQLRIMRSRHHFDDDWSTGRYAIITFDSANIANAVIYAINMMVLTVDEETTTLRAAPFVPNFRQLLQKSCIAVDNLPTEIGASDLKDLFSEFGAIISAVVSGTRKNDGDSQTGYVLVEKEEEAKRAIEEANGKFLGPNQITVTKHRGVQQGVEEGAV